MQFRIIPAIMSGGAGARLWPLSTAARPKQFHALCQEHSLFAQTLRRVRGAPAGLSFEAPIVLCNIAHRDLIRGEFEQAGAEAAAIVLEPAPRNTAAIAAIAAALAAELDPEALVLLLPADHIIDDIAAFHAAIARGAPFARGRIVTFGIAPDGPATGYGYIKGGAELAHGIRVIDSFREKPNLDTARQYLREGGYCWNAGMFLFHPRMLLAEFDASAEIRDGALSALANATRANGEIVLDAERFSRVPAAPLDIAVMEKTKRAAMVPCAMGWADVGAWDEIWRLSPKDEHGNAVQGQIVARDAANNLLRAEGVTLCVAGVSDLIVVATRDAIIVLPRERAQEVKTLRDLASKL